jgi:hypothetical protein
MGLLYLRCILERLKCVAMVLKTFSSSFFVCLWKTIQHTAVPATLKELLIAQSHCCRTGAQRATV